MKISTLLCACAGFSTFAAAPAVAQPPLADAATLQRDMLEVHNRYRAAVGAPPLVWDAQLAANAQGYARAATGGSLEHAPADQRVGQGENLWQGSEGGWQPTAMAEDWAGERQHFQAGTFPNVNPSGGVVGHYTQMIWRTTTRVGCGLHRAGGNDYLVCRYGPAGNMEGVAVP